MMQQLSNSLAFCLFLFVIPKDCASRCTWVMQHHPARRMNHFNPKCQSYESTPQRPKVPSHPQNHEEIYAKSQKKQVTSRSEVLEYQMVWQNGHICLLTKARQPAPQWCVQCLGDTNTFGNRNGDRQSENLTGQREGWVRPIAKHYVQFFQTVVIFSFRHYQLPSFL